MSRRGEHLVWPTAGAVLSVHMKGTYGRAIGGGLAADFVERQKTVEAVERGVLDPFGGDRSRYLLKLHRERAHAAAHQLGARGQLDQQRRAHEIEHRRLGEGAA